ncbi:DUF1697 domain-containing protein [Brevibacillus ginsengisoli]|uniref:DUF1697 domain-containing protein n=1 Tax=Brevibacillus ginsengisoli TaxID=363854 RepID=UPI003CF05811
MTIYIALLRGINVGGKNKIKMADLKRMFEEMGLSRVQTYIQSGNVLFESNEGEEALSKRLEQEIKHVFGLSISVILRAATELEQIVVNCPFTEAEIAEAEASGEGESLYVALLPQSPSEEGIQRLSTYQNENEQFRINGRDIYLLFQNSVRDSKLAAQVAKLNVPATVRNWKTTNKLVTLSKAMEE